MDTLTFANSRRREDRYGIPHIKPGCQADPGLGYVPGVIYLDGYWRKEFLCLGYTADGAVQVKDVETGEVRQHRTSLSKTTTAVRVVRTVRATVR